MHLQKNCIEAWIKRSIILYHKDDFQKCDIGQFEKKRIGFLEENIFQDLNFELRYFGEDSTIKLLFSPAFNKMQKI